MPQSMLPCGLRQSPVSSLADEAFAKEDGELCLGLDPRARRPFAFLGRVSTRHSRFIAASSLGTWPRVRTARRSLEFSASMAFVVDMIRRTLSGKAKKGTTCAQLRRQPSAIAG